MAGQVDLGKVVGTDGQGVPTGGSTGQALVKQSASDYDTVWQKLNTATPESLAIVSNGDTHEAIASGQYVYVRGHSTLAEGLYTARAAIAVNGTLSLSNLAAVSNGGLNLLNSIIPVQLIHMGTENDYPLSTEQDAYQLGVTLMRTLSTTEYPYTYGTVVTIRCANARCVQFSFGNSPNSYKLRTADSNGWSAWKTYSGS